MRNTRNQIDFTELLETNSTFRKTIMELDILEITTLTNLSIDDVRTLKFQCYMMESGEWVKE